MVPKAHRAAAARPGLAVPKEGGGPSGKWRTEQPLGGRRRSGQRGGGRRGDRQHRDRRVAASAGSLAASARLSGFGIQLGAFSSEAAANNEWRLLRAGLGLSYRGCRSMS